MPLKKISLSKLNSELDCWLGDLSASTLGQKCIDLEYFPWEAKNFPTFLHSYLNKSKSLLEKSIKARYFWKDCPPEHRENYLFLYDHGIEGKLTFNINPSSSWPQPSKASGLNTQVLLLMELDLNA